MKSYKVYWRYNSESGMGHSFKTVKADNMHEAEEKFKRDCNYGLTVTHVVAV